MQPTIPKNIKIPKNEHIDIIIRVVLVSVSFY
jgi:hypothetical protein